jgi:hypothetical protein
MILTKISRLEESANKKRIESILHNSRTSRSSIIHTLRLLTQITPQTEYLEIEAIDWNRSTYTIYIPFKVQWGMGRV